MKIDQRDSRCSTKIGGTNYYISITRSAGRDARITISSDGGSYLVGLTYGELVRLAGAVSEAMDLTRRDRDGLE